MFRTKKVNYVPGFTTIFNLCWDTMYYRGTAVWENNKSHPGLAQLQPRFDGGVWNCGYFSGTSMCGDPNAPPELPMNPPDTDQGTNLSGIQNTVTNGLYLVLASRPPSRRRLASTWKPRRASLTFSGSGSTADPSDVALLQVPDGGVGKLVRERVATYAGGTKAYVNGYDKDLSWSGDQGIIVGGLIDWMIVVPADKNPQSVASLGVCALNGRDVSKTFRCPAALDDP